MDIKNQINKAFELQQKGQLFEAEKLYTEILNTEPNNANVLNLYGLLKYQIKQFEDAISYIKKALENNYNAYFLENLGRAYYSNNNLESAIEAYKKALEVEPDNFDIWFNLALALKKNQQTDDAIKAFQKAISIKPDAFDAYFNLGNIYTGKNDTLSAIDAYQKSVDYNPRDLDAQYFLSIEYLKTKNFKEGWKYFESRLCKEVSIITQENALPKNLITSKPLWNGEPIDNKILFVYYEAGFGDTMMFARYLPLLKNKCSKVLFRPQIGLVSLFKDSFPDIEVLDTKDCEKDFNFDVHTPIMSLPYLLNLNSEADIPFAEGYLKTNTEKVNFYKKNYFENTEFKIGIKWEGNPSVDQNRIIPFDAFFKLFDLPNTKFYSLQKDEGLESLENLPENYEITNLGRTFNDFSDTAAAIENLDLVICNDTSVAHLVGAIGKPCWILLPYQYNWRWHTDLSYSPWYKYSKLFSQSKPNTWNEVFDKIYSNLNNVITEFL